jgi:hypothetical protein
MRHRRLRRALSSLAVLVGKYRHYRRVLRLPPRLAWSKARWHAGARSTPEPAAYELVGRIRALAGPIVMLEDDGGALWHVPSLLDDLDGRRVRIMVTVLDRGAAPAKSRGGPFEGV